MDEEPMEPRRQAPAPASRTSLTGPRTANATVTWLGELATNPGGIAKSINANGAIVGTNGDGGLGLSFRPGPVRVVWGVADPIIPGYYYDHTLSAHGINSSGLVVGEFLTFQGSMQSLYVSPVVGSSIYPDIPGSRPTSLPELSTSWGHAGFGLAISDAGDVVGTTRGPYPINYNEWHGTLWRASAGYEPVDLGLLDGVNTAAMAIAPGLSGANTLIAGQTGDGGFSNQQAFLWRDGVFTLLPQAGTSSAYWTEAHDVTDNGLVVGFDYQVGAVLWRNGQVVNLAAACPGGSQGYSFANGIAFTSSIPSRTLIVGHCSNQPVVWYDDGAGGFVAEALPLLTGDTEGNARDVNASGQIVGQSGDPTTRVNHAVLWTFTVPGSTNQPPTAAPGGPYAGNEGTSVSFNGATSSDPDGQALTYDWDFGDGSAHGTGATPSHMYADNGSYTVSLTVNDGAGGSDTRTTTASIANRTPTLGAVSTTPTGSLLKTGTTVTAASAFTDLGTLDTHTGTIVWDVDNPAYTPVPATINRPAGATTGTVSASAVLAEGVYTVQLEVTDKDAATGSATATNYLVVYDPTGGSVAGNGTIQSPAGACTLASCGGGTTAGPATFAFSAKYKRGTSTAPTGSTSFKFTAGSLNFASTSVQWLVVAGPLAQYKGQGKVNKKAGYGFLVTAVDGNQPGGGGVDKFRIKIWELTTGNVVYDNHRGAAEDSNAATAITSGTITITP
jgi:PKD repeat protein